MSKCKHCNGTGEVKEVRDSESIFHEFRGEVLTLLTIENGINADLEQSDSFISYWTEQKPNGKQMRFEGEKYFDIKRRLSTWIKNDKNWNKKEPQKEQLYKMPGNYLKGSHFKERQNETLNISELIKKNTK